LGHFGIWSEIGLGFYLTNYTFVGLHPDSIWKMAHRDVTDYNSSSNDSFFPEEFLYMALISMQDVSIGFGGPRLLEEINLQIESGEWVGLLGRNGMGKSTLLKLISGEVLPHSGTIARQQNIRIAYLPQEVPV
jgi:ABC-type transport system involved in cytochrome bd biosynthesis fused ATPase/permease subunit